jgi:hypothetical protein
MGERRGAYRYVMKRPEKRNHLSGLRVSGWIMLKLTFKKEWKGA